MTDRPVLFSGPMIRAIRAGQKTVTRRVVRQLGNRDRLWVKETWAAEAHYDDLSPRDIGHDLGTHDLGPVLWYAADDDSRPGRGRWRRSIHMPRWASRITLDVEDVRVERLQDITTEGIRAEGVALANREGDA